MASGRKWAPALLAGSVLAFIAGQVSSLHGGSVLFGSAASATVGDAAYLLSYAMLVLGTIALGWHRLPSGTEMRTAADYLMILSALATFSWYFFIGPAFDSSRLTVSGQITSTAYDSFDLVLAVCLFALASRFRTTDIRPALVCLGLAIVTLIFCHCLSVYGTLYDAGRQPAHLALVWSLAYIWVGGAGVAIRYTRSRSPATEDSGLSALATPGLWHYLFPYAVIPSVVALLVYQAHQSPPTYLEVGSYVAASIMIELALVHQFLAYRELISYANRSARLESLAAADPVTGLPNQRSVITVLDTLVRQADLDGTPLSVLFVDLDRFKSLNDRLGHAAGDRALREFAAVVRTQLRASDAFGRWGGEEFVALLPESDSPSALAVAERICDTVASRTFRTVGGARVTCSIGVATYPGDGLDRAELIEAADTAMYTAKQRGRNQAIAADASGSTGAGEEPDTAGKPTTLTG